MDRFKETYKQIYLTTDFIVWSKTIKDKTNENSFVEYSKELDNLLISLQTELNLVNIPKNATLSVKGALLQMSDDMLCTIYRLLYGYRYYVVSVETRKTVIEGHFRTYNALRSQYMTIHLNESYDPIKHRNRI